MRPVSPVIPERDAAERRFVKDGSYDLPAIVDEQNGVTSRWLVSDEEVEQIKRQGYTYVRQQTDGSGVQPIHIGVECPIQFSEPAETDSILDADELIIP
jgi:hypothetical protein